MAFPVHWAIVSDSIEMYQHVTTSTALGSRNPSIILNRCLVKWMECLLLWENNSKALNSIIQKKIMWKFKLSRKKTVNHLWTWHCIKHTPFSWLNLTPPYHFFFCVIIRSALSLDQPVVPAIIPPLLYFCPFSHASLHVWKNLSQISSNLIVLSQMLLEMFPFLG